MNSSQTALLSASAVHGKINLAGLQQDATFLDITVEDVQRRRAVHNVPSSIFTKSIIMTSTSKILVLSGVLICAVLAALFFVFARGAMSESKARSYEGYFSPVYSPDGQYVYFIERSITGTVEQTGPVDIFSSPRFDVQVAKDRFILKRMRVENSQIEELRHLPPSPIQGRHYETIGSPFHVAGTRLRFTEDHKLEFKVCLTIHQEPSAIEYLSSGVWVEGGGAPEITDEWKNSPCSIQGYDEWPLFGDRELLAIRRMHYFPVAIVAYNHVTRDVKVLIKNKDYDQLYPNGVPLQQIEESSVRPRVERVQEVMRVHKELLQKYKAMGMGEMQALLRTGKDMQQLGLYPKTPTIVARRLERAAANGLDKDALFRIPKGEMESGIFPDIEHAIARPGEEIDKSSGEYHTHRDYSTSARLNKFLKAGNTRFYVEYLGETYELTIYVPEEQRVYSPGLLIYPLR